MAFTFSADPSPKERKKAAQDRARASRARARAERAEQERAQQEHARRWWDHYHRRQYSAPTGIQAQDKEMAQSIIDAGYRALSRKYHPDMGGSHEAMVQVNRALEALRKLVS